MGAKNKKATVAKERKRVKKNKYIYLLTTTILLGMLVGVNQVGRLEGAELADAVSEELQSSTAESTEVSETEKLLSEEQIIEPENSAAEAITPFAGNKYLEYSDLHEINYDENNGTPMFRDLGIPETASNTTTVKTFDEMRAAILNVNINYIYMGANIKLTSGGVKIPYDKKYMRISGKNPETGQIHTLEEATTSTGSSTANIHVSNTTSQQAPTSYGLEDINLNAHTYYGTINVNDNSYYVHLTQTNANYDGPQPTHNLNGTNDYHNYKADIYQGKPNTAQGQELAEAHFINLFGNFELNHDGQHSIAWFGFGNNVKGIPGHFKVKENANVKIRSTGRSFFYFERTDSYFTVEKNAYVDIEAGGGLVRDDIASSGQSIKDLVVEEEAVLKITRKASRVAADNRLPTLDLSGNISVANNARLYMNNESDSSGQADQFIMFRSSNARVDIDQAKSVLFYNPKGKILNGAANNNVGHFNSEVASMNLWKTLPTSQFILTPDHHYSFPDNSNISFKADIKRVSANNHATTILAANPLDITATALDFNALKIISMGIVPTVTVEPITDKATQITGTATDEGTVVATYDDGEGEKKLTALADKDGNYVIDIPKRGNGGQYIKPYTKVQMEVFYDYRTSPIVTTEVIDVSAPEGDPVTTIIEKDTPQAAFPKATEMVTNLWDKSLETAHPKLTVAYGKQPIPNLSLIGPVIPFFEVTVTDEAGHETAIKVPIFVKDKETEISKEKTYAVRGKDVVVRTMEYPKTNAELLSFIRKESELQGWNIETGEELSLTDINVEQGTVPQPEELSGTVPIGEHKVTFSYGAGDSKVTRVISFKIIPSTAKLTIRFVDEDKKAINPNIERVDDIGKKIDLTKDSEVADVITILEKNKYKLQTRPANEEAVEILEDGTTVTYQFVGTIKLVSAPTDVDFGSVSITDFKKRVGVDKNDMATPLIVEDTRKARQKWDITAQVEKEMTNGDDIQIGALKYVVNKKEHTLTGSAQTIYANDGSSSEGIYNITNNWGKAELADGLKLEIESDRVPKTTGSYEGIIRWTLRDTIE